MSEQRQEASEGLPHTFWGRAWWRIKRDWAARAGALCVLAMVAMAIAGPWVVPYSESAQDASALLQGPSWAHPLGTDQLGRDLLARLCYGARISLGVACVTSVVAMVLGTALGAISGWIGGRTDNVLMRMVDVIYSFPDLLLIIIISVVIGQGVVGITLSLSLVSWVTVARVVRG